MNVLLAHEGGWDEALLVAVPILFIFVMLRWAKKRAEAANAVAAPVNSDPTTGPAPTSRLNENP